MTINPDALTERELSILQSLLDVNDRGGFYSVLNALHEAWPIGAELKTHGDARDHAKREG